MPPVAAGLGRQYKLVVATQFRAVLENKNAIHGKYFSIHTKKNELKHARMGVTVSRKVSKKAVQRNRIKRQIRESYRYRKNKLESGDFVVIAKIGCAEVENVMMKLELDTLWLKANEKCAKS